MHRFKPIIYIIILCFVVDAYGQNGPLNSFYNKKGKLIEDTNYVLNNYDSRKDILKDEAGTLAKILEKMAYSTMAKENILDGKILIVITFDKGFAKEISCLKLDSGTWSCFCYTKHLNAFLPDLVLNQPAIKKVFIPVRFTIENEVNTENKAFKRVNKTFLEIHEGRKFHEIQY